MQKRALSSVVTVVLLIAIGLVAVSIVWFAVRPLINSLNTGTSSTGQPSGEVGVSSSSSCITSLVHVVSCSFDSATNETNVQVTRNSQAGSVNSVRFIFSQGSDSVSLLSNQVPEPLETQTYTFVNDSLGSFTSVDVALVIGGVSCSPSGRPLVCLREEAVELSSGGLNFSFLPPGYLNELNWTSPNGEVHRIVWDEQQIGPNSLNRYHPSGVRSYLHSIDSPGENGWGYVRGSENVNRTHSELNYVLSNQSSSSVLISTYDPYLRVENTFSFSESTMTLTSRIRNTGGVTLDQVTIPYYLGSLVMGSGDNYAQAEQLTNTGITRLVPTKVGQLVPNFNDNNAVAYSYPTSLSVFSPVVSMYDSQKTIGEQLVTQLAIPDSVSFYQKIALQHLPAMVSRLYLEKLVPGEERTITLVFRFSEPGNWRDSLEPYRSWFHMSYGETPTYCPAPPFGYFVGSNNPSLFNTTGRTYFANTTLQSVFAPTGAQDNLAELGVRKFGVWRSTISVETLLASGELNEFNPAIELFDPNLDVSRNASKISSLNSLYDSSDIDLFWFARPCKDIVGANISYASGDPIITQGVPQDVDLRDSLSRERQLARLDYFASRGVKGFYFDEMECPGTQQFIGYARDTFAQRYSFNPEDFYILKEGAIDREALLWPQAPQLKYSSGDQYTTDASLLYSYLVPDASLYSISFPQRLDFASEQPIALQQGYVMAIDFPLSDQFVQYAINNPSSQERISLCQYCALFEQSVQNVHDRWERYGSALGCSEPSEIVSCPLSC